LIGGIKYEEQQFNDVVAQAMSSLMFVATGSLILPAAFQAALPHDKKTEAQILALSRGTAIVLLIIYILYLFFQLKTHAHLYAEAAGAEEEEVVIGPYVSAATLVVVTFGIAVCSEYLVDSIDAVVATSGVSKTFIGLILLPIVGNAGTFSHLRVAGVDCKRNMLLPWSWRTRIRWISQLAWQLVRQCKSLSSSLPSWSSSAGSFMNP
jgi:Ca2+:H+ antiporter